MSDAKAKEDKAFEIAAKHHKSVAEVLSEQLIIAERARDAALEDLMAMQQQLEWERVYQREISDDLRARLRAARAAALEEVIRMIKERDYPVEDGRDTSCDILEGVRALKSKP